MPPQQPRPPRPLAAALRRRAQRGGGENA
uniref:Uncharacterized protein n=1 Tax=Arundo donax TaxID=35708 RepID=A0A0A9C1S2_ARUDO